MSTVDRAQLFLEAFALRGDIYRALAHQYRWSREEIEDIVQEAVLRVAAAGIAPHRMRYLLLRVARNYAVDVARKQRRFLSMDQLLKLGTVNDDESETVDELETVNELMLAEELRPDVLVEANQSEALLKQMIATRSLQQRSVFGFRALGYLPREIQVCMGLSEEAVDSSIQSIRRATRRYLANKDNG